jgi:hypothetical protein
MQDLLEVQPLLLEIVLIPEEVVWFLAIEPK